MEGDCSFAHAFWAIDVDKFALVFVEMGDDVLDLESPAEKLEFVVNARHVVHFADVVLDLDFGLLAWPLKVRVLLEQRGIEELFILLIKDLGFLLVFFL